MPINFIKTKAKVILSSLFVAVVLLLVIILGLSKGKAQAQSETVMADQQSLQKGLQYFYNDQNRYPSAVEFADPSTMLTYFNIFPPQNFVSKNCSQSYNYQRSNLTSFSLSFCLPVAVQGYPAGWNSVSGN